MEYIEILRENINQHNNLIQKYSNVKIKKFLKIYF